MVPQRRSGSRGTRRSHRGGTWTAGPTGRPGAPGSGSFSAWCVTIRVSLIVNHYAEKLPDEERDLKKPARPGGQRILGRSWDCRWPPSPWLVPDRSTPVACQPAKRRRLHRQSGEWRDRAPRPKGRSHVAQTGGANLGPRRLGPTAHSPTSRPAAPNGATDAETHAQSTVLSVCPQN